MIAWRADDSLQNRRINGASAIHEREACASRSFSRFARALSHLHRLTNISLTALPLCIDVLVYF